MKPLSLLTSLRLYGDIILKTPIPNLPYEYGLNSTLKLMAKEMPRIMYAFHGVGLAANQVGMLERMIVVDVIGQPLVMFNPKITQFSYEQRVKYEGCLSIPGLQKMVKRYRYVSVSYLDLEWKEQTLDLLSPNEKRMAEQTDFEMISRIIQHEIDHLDGILIIDRGE